MRSNCSLATLTALFLLGGAKAATVSYSGSVSDVDVDNPYGAAEVVVTQFDNSVGGPNGDQIGASLNSVTLVLSGSQYAEFLLSNAQGEGETWYIYINNGAVIFGNGPLSTDMNVSQTMQYVGEVNVPAGSEKILFLPGTIAAIGTGVATFTSGFEAFQGNGTLNQNIYFSGGWGVMGLTVGDSLINSVYTGSAEWGVIYDYTPVPEPSAVALLLAGGAALAWRARGARRSGRVES